MKRIYNVIVGDEIKDYPSEFSGFTCYPFEYNGDLDNPGEAFKNSVKDFAACIGKNPEDVTIGDTMKGLSAETLSKHGLRRISSDDYSDELFDNEDSTVL